MGQMRIAIVGATGGTGQHVLTQALEAGHQVTAFARDPSKITTQHEHLHVVPGALPDDRAMLGQALRGQDRLVCVLGRGLSFKSENLIRQSVPILLDAMKTERVRRLIFTSALGVGETFADAPLVSKVFITLLLRNIYADKLVGDTLVKASDLDWTIVHPAQLTDGPLTKQYRAGEHLALGGIPRISRADTAHFIMSQLEDRTYLRKVVIVGY